MSRILKSGGALLALTSLLLVGAGASGSAAQERRSCDAQRGSTQFENPQVRVFSSGSHVYACAHHGRRTFRLQLQFLGHTPSTTTSRTRITFDGDVQLAGGFLAWTETEVNGDSAPTFGVIVLDPSRGTHRLGASDYTPDLRSHTFIRQYVLNSHGTVVWIEEHEGGLSHPYYDVVQNTPAGTKILDESTTIPGPCCGNAEISGLALSEDGRLAYWTNGSAVKSARIP